MTTMVCSAGSGADGADGISSHTDTWHAQEQVQFAARERPPKEMRQKARGRDAFFSASRLKDRPYSVYTEFMESDTEIEHGDDHDDDDSEVYSEFGDLEGIDDGECSPRVSVGSVGDPWISGRPSSTEAGY